MIKNNIQKIKKEIFAKIIQIEKSKNSTKKGLIRYAGPTMDSSEIIAAVNSIIDGQI